MDLSQPDEARLYFERDLEVPETFGFAGGLAVVYTHRSPDRVTANEDAAALIPFDAESGLLVVADGVGGVRSGEQASRQAVETMWTELSRAVRQGSPSRSAVLDAFETANEMVTGLGLGAATTVSAVEIQGRSARPYHVGDSMILFVGGLGKIKLQTVPHSPVGFAVEAGVLDEAEAMHHEDRHLVSNVLGTPDMRIEVGSVSELALRDTIVLASDGLSDNLHTFEIAELVRCGPIEQAASRLVAETRTRMAQTVEGDPSKPDDLTVLVFRRSPSNRDGPVRDATRAR